MKTSSYSLFSQLSAAGCACMIFFVHTLSPLIFAETTTPANTTTTTTTQTAQATLAKTDITAVGMNMFSTAYNWEVGSNLGYNDDAYKGFAKKLNTIIKNSKDGGFVEMVKKCGGCSTVVDNGFDAALIKYHRETPPEFTNSEPAYFAVVNPYLHEKIRTARLPADTQNLLNKTIASMVSGIKIQVREQMDAFRDVSGMGLYYDGDINNSPYDLLEDVRRIDAIFFREPPAYGDYKNSSKDDASALISGQAHQGVWMGGGKNYDLNLLGDIKEAYGNNTDSSGNSGTSGNSNEAAGDCSSGYCVTVDFIQSTHYFLGGTAQSPTNGKGTSSSGAAGKESFQGILEEALEWVTKNGDKRNFACKAAPTINFYESENDMNFSFSKIFSGLGIFVIWKVPKFLLGFIDRNKTQSNSSGGSSGSSSSTTQTKEDKETESALHAAFKAKGLDFDKPVNFKNSADKAFTDSGFKNATDGEKRAINFSESVAKSEEVYQQILKENGAGGNRALIHEYNKDSIKHLEKVFDEIASRARLVRQFSEDINKILKYLKEKPDCTN